MNVDLPANQQTTYSGWPRALVLVPVKGMPSGRPPFDGPPLDGPPVGGPPVGEPPAAGPAVSGTPVGRPPVMACQKWSEILNRFF